MADSSRERHTFQFKIFGGTEDPETIDKQIEQLDEPQSSYQAGVPRRPSVYVTVFEEMINTVYEGEMHLLSAREWEVFNAYQNLSYNSRYCLVRLLHRKPNQWFALSALEHFTKEVGGDGVFPSLAPLCLPLHERSVEPIVVVKKEEDRDIVDFTLDTYDEAQRPTTGGQTPTADSLQSVLSSDLCDLNLDYFLQDETHMSLYDLLNRMNRNELVKLARQNRCVHKLNAKKGDIISSLVLNATTQSVLNFDRTSLNQFKGQGTSKGLHQTQLNFPRLSKHSNKRRKFSQEQQLRQQVLNLLGKCFRVNFDFYRLARRLHIIAYRATEHPDRLCLPALMNKFKKWAYSDYTYKRDPAVWSSRHQLLEYERALELEQLLDEVVESTLSDAKGCSKTPAPRRSEFTTPATPSHNFGFTTPVKSPGINSKQYFADVSGSSKLKMEQPSEDLVPLENNPGNAFVETPHEQKARKVLQHFDNWIFPRWQDQVAVKKEKGSENHAPSLERFEPGHVYTRMVHKALTSFARLKEYQKEADVIQALLQQRAWRRGKRAKLYERRAIIQTQYLCRNEDGKYDPAILRVAMDGIKEALLDDDTSLVSRPSLLKRLRRLEKKLNIPMEERVQCIGELRKAEIVEIKAKRIFHRAGSLSFDATGNIIKGKENTPGTMGMRAYFSPTSKEGVTSVQKQTELKPQESKGWKWKGKSIWEGRNGEEVNVEERALQYYRDLGYKGFHSETSILTMIFALLFWDVIFADIRGAFETPYQSAPLDIAEDSFYFSRNDIIGKRLTEIQNGSAKDILVRHDAKHRGKNTCCIGLRWELCERQDLLEIIECIGGNSLSLICKLFCQDYAGRSSGGPDLIVWNSRENVCKFVEVKGPGDTPQENQKFWFDSLLGADVNVEICKVTDVNEVKARTNAKGKGKAPIPSTTRKRKRKAKTKPGESHSESELDEERNYDKLDTDCEPDDVLPQARNPKRRRVTDPGASASDNHSAPPRSPVIVPFDDSRSQCLQGANIVIISQ